MKYTVKACMAGIGVLLFVGILIGNGRQTLLKSEVFSVNNGYGYEIVYKGKVLIRQAFIPAITDKQAFQSEDDAQKVAMLVIKRLRNKEKPTVQKKDLDSMKIEMNNN